MPSKQGRIFFFSRWEKSWWVKNVSIPWDSQVNPSSFFLLDSSPLTHMWMLLLYPSLWVLQPLWHLGVISCFSNPEAYLVQLSGVTSLALFSIPLITPQLQSKQAAFYGSLQRWEHWPTFPAVSSVWLLQATRPPAYSHRSPLCRIATRQPDPI